MRQKKKLGTKILERTTAALLCCQFAYFSCAEAKIFPALTGDDAIDRSSGYNISLASDGVTRLYNFTAGDQITVLENQAGVQGGVENSVEVSGIGNLTANSAGAIHVNPAGVPLTVTVSAAAGNAVGTTGDGITKAEATVYGIIDRHDTATLSLGSNTSFILNARGGECSFPHY